MIGFARRAPILLVFAATLCFPAAPIEAQHETGQKHDDAARRATIWLASTLKSAAWRSPEMAWGNTLAKRHVTETMAAYLLLLHPDLARETSLRNSLHEKICATAREPDGVVIRDYFTNWIKGFAGLYLLERAERGFVEREALRALAADYATCQNAESGWGHGRRTTLAFYPSTMVITSCWALFVLGGCRHHAIGVADETIDSGLRMLREVQAVSGGFPYGGPGFRSACEAGRTCGVILALAATGHTADRAFKRSARYVRRNMTSIPTGHSSPALHLFTGAMATRILGAEARAVYDREVLFQVHAAQREDGSFRDISSKASDSTDLSADALTNSAYRTVFYAAALAVSRSRLAERLRCEDHGASWLTESPTPRTDPTEPPQAGLRWSMECGPVSALILRESWCGIRGEDGRLDFCTTDHGELRGRASLPPPGRAVRATDWIATENHVVVWTPPKRTLELPRSPEEAAKAAAARGPKGTLACFPIEGGDARWKTPVPGDVRTLCAAGDKLLVLTDDGELSARSIGSGRTLRTYPRARLLASTHLAPLGNGGIAWSVEARLRALEPDGDVQWEFAERRPAGVTPPPFSAIAALGPDLVTGNTAGTVACRNATTGEVKWSVSLESSVVSLFFVSRSAIFALTADRRVHAIRDRRVRWVFDEGLGRESRERPKLLHDGERLWIASPIRKRILALDPNTGRPTCYVPLTPDASWSAWRGRIVIAGSGRVTCRQID